MRKSFALSLTILGFIVTYSFSQNTVDPDNIKIGQMRSTYSLNEGWKYLQDGVQCVGELENSSVPWVDVTLPHTWNRYDVVDQVPGYRRNAGWYQREIMIPQNYGDKRFILYFEGVNLKCKVFVNGSIAGEHVGGYVGFDVDITPYLKPGTANIILVRADNSFDLNLIPSQKSDFFIYGGITRNVWLKVVPSNYIDQLTIRTPHVSDNDAETMCDVTLMNQTSGSSKFYLNATIRDAQDNIVSRASSVVKIKEKSESIAIKFPKVKNPHLWSPSDPALYTMTIELYEARTKIDQLSDRFGYRWYEFKDHGPFFLNEKRLLLRGTQRHEDYAGYGMAMPDSLQRKDIRMIKELGANFVRLAHYPQAPEVYRACDELGLLVWDELPWCRGGVGGEQWQAITKHLLKEQIEQNINHPSIIIWSLGNESYWVPDVPGGDNPDSIKHFMTQLNTIAHTLDPARLTACRKIEDAAGIVDVFSPSIWAGWYSGNYKNYEKLITAARDKYPRMVHMEYGGDSHIGRHTEHPISGDGFLSSDVSSKTEIGLAVKNIAVSSDWNENYIVNLFDWHLHETEQLDWFTGNAQWIFKDFPTPLRPEDPIPYMNQKGLVDRAGNPKDAYYVFKSYWTTSPKFCYIESHTWTYRAGPSGVQRTIKVFSNCEEVELIVNGKSFGKRTRDINDFPASGLRWDVMFEEGNNAVEAIGYIEGKKIAHDSLQVHYTYEKIGSPSEITLTSKKLPSGHVLITATAVDDNGRRCIDYNKRIYFSSMEGGALVRYQGTPTGSDVIEMSNGQANIEFIPDTGTPMLIEARNQDFKGTYLRIQ